MRRKAIVGTTFVLVLLGVGEARSSAPSDRPGCPVLYSAGDYIAYGRTVMPTPTRGQANKLAIMERCQFRKGRRKTVRRWRARHEQPPGWAIPTYIVMCESGGANLRPNGASASGYYQIIYSTWHENGGGRFADEAWLATKAQQDEVARRIWRSGGPGQWDCA